MMLRVLGVTIAFLGILSVVLIIIARSTSNQDK